MTGRLLTSSESRFWVTCYTDASFGPSGAGWAVWARCVEGRVVRRGACPGYVTSSLEAELAAIFAGVFVACRTWGARIRGVVVRTDCQAAIHLLTTDHEGAQGRRSACAPPGVPGAGGGRASAASPSQAQGLS
ncbi:hypothetical protein BE08_42920 [Sorangium cellulosum]|uniref:RNase H type-1 domain-containing protein n=1 Tax=Sorangium cellulosum TaxID=56 RepID=A0A150PLW4_SORCE|nr:hypothetical protein BE08_42920 [Sorangium cellulosum]